MNANANAIPTAMITRALTGRVWYLRPHAGLHRPKGVVSGCCWSGFDTPETHHPRKPVQCYGPEAAAHTASRLFGQVVRLEDDVERHDIYGRRLAYVYLDGHNYERELLQQGYARLLVIEPNHAHARAMLDDELNARARHVGLWGACGDS